MTKKLATTNAGGEIAPTSNVALMHTMMEQLIKRDPGLPGIGAFYGPSGLGKSFAAAYASHPGGFNGVYVECHVYDTMKSLVEAIAKALGLTTARGTIAAQMGLIIEALAIANRPLIVDEGDVLVDSNRLELVRNLHDASGAPVLIIGEETLPAKLKRHERFDNRILVWQPAVRCSLADLDQLAKQYCGAIVIDPALKQRVLTETQGVTRRVVTNLVNIKRWCEAKGTKEAPAECNVTLYTGLAPGRTR
jgi:DNA transposition AAA+ family ATPase